MIFAVVAIAVPRWVRIRRTDAALAEGNRS